jgi:hypothetical protein
MPNAYNPASGGLKLQDLKFDIYINDAPSESVVVQSIPAPLKVHMRLDIWRYAKKNMRKHLLYAGIILFTTILTLIFIVIGGLLPPGILEPETERIRFISDGFAQYRWVPLLCVCLMAIQVVCFFLFAKAAAHHIPGPIGSNLHLIVISFGAISWFGLLLVAFNTEGSFHYSGAGFFIFSNIMMHYFLDRIIWMITQQTFTERMLEYGILLIGSISFLLFGFFIFLGWTHNNKDASSFLSSSAVFEYIVFVSFVGMNLYGASMMAYIALWYETSEETDGGSRRVWVKRTYLEIV